MQTITINSDNDDSEQSIKRMRQNSGYIFGEIMTPELTDEQIYEVVALKDRIAAIYNSVSPEKRKAQHEHNRQHREKCAKMWAKIKSDKRKARV